MKKIILITSLIAFLGGCKGPQQDGCNGPDRIVFKEAKAAFLESGFVLLEMAQDSSWAKSVPYWNCQPCSKIDFSKYKVQKDNGSINLNYQITCGIKLDRESINYNNAPALRIAIYSVKPL